MLVSSNYAQILCKDCKKIIHIMPDDPFDRIECLCTNEVYADMSIDDLREIGKEKKIKSAMQMSKETLIKKLEEIQ